MQLLIIFFVNAINQSIKVIGVSSISGQTILAFIVTNQKFEYLQAISKPLKYNQW